MGEGRRVRRTQDTAAPQPGGQALPRSLLSTLSTATRRPPPSGTAEARDWDALWPRASMGRGPWLWRPGPPPSSFCRSLKEGLGAGTEPRASFCPPVTSSPVQLGSFLVTELQRRAYWVFLNVATTSCVPPAVSQVTDDPRPPRTLPHRVEAFEHVPQGDPPGPSLSQLTGRRGKTAFSQARQMRRK